MSSSRKSSMPSPGDARDSQARIAESVHDIQETGSSSQSQKREPADLFRMKPPKTPQSGLQICSTMLAQELLNSLQETADKIFPIGSGEYKKVSALLLAFAHGLEETNHFIHEMHTMEKVLREDYHFATYPYLIPPESPMLNLHTKLASIGAMHQDNGLLIIFYSGHSYLDQDGKVMWASSSFHPHHSKVVVNLSVLEAFVQKSPSDVFLMIDSSYAVSSMLPGTKSSSKHFEVLAASGGNRAIPINSKHSFSLTLAKVLRKLKGDTFTAAQLHARLLFDDKVYGLLQSPLYINHSFQGGSIRLAALPFPRKQEADSTPLLRKQRKISISISLTEPLQNTNIDSWRVWMSTEAPRNIEKIELLLQNSDEGLSAKDPDSFTLLVSLQETLIPDSEAWVHWIGKLPATVLTVDVEILPSDPPDSNDALHTFVANLNLEGGIALALKKVFYEHVTVLPLMWDDPDPDEVGDKYDALIAERREMKDELKGISNVFRNRFNFGVEDIWLIPDDKNICQKRLGQKIEKFAGKHDKENTLAIIVYGGHGKETRLYKSGQWGLAQEGHSVWVANPIKNPSWVDWTLIQSRLVEVDCDALMIIDCCYAGNAARDESQQKTKEILGASQADSPAWSGPRAFSKLLKRKLESIPIPFTVSHLYQEMVDEFETLPLLSKNPEALIARPSHGWAGGSDCRTIHLMPLPRFKEIEEKSPASTTADGANKTANARIFMEIELDHSQPLDAKQWDEWFKKRPPPPSMSGIKFYTEEEVCMKVITEQAVSSRTKAPEGFDNLGVLAFGV